MDESDEDFKELCASFFQRVKKTTKDVAGERKAQKAVNGAEPRRKPQRARQTQSKSTALPEPIERKCLSSTEGLKRRKPGAALGSQPTPPENGDAGVLASAAPPECRNSLTECGPSSEAQPPPSHPWETNAPKPCAAELVVQRMQQFKRAHPRRLRHTTEGVSLEATLEDEPPEPPGEEPTAEPGSELPASEIDDGAVARALQQELGQEREPPPSSSLEETGLFFCQMCQKDLSAMNLVRREQHLNRCLDEAEKAQRPPVAPVPECPICGKPCLTPKSRISHLKQCAAKMEVSPRLLVQAVQLQTAQPEGAMAPSTPASSHVGGLRRKGPPNKEPRKRQKVGHEPPSEDLLVAMALSLSEMEQEATPAALRLGGTKLGAALEKRGRRKRGPMSPPQLLVQDPETTGRQFEDRVAQLLSEEPVVASTPSLPASRILETLGTASWCLQQQAGTRNFLWEGSALCQGWAPTAFYSTHLGPSLRPKPAEKPALPGPQSPCPTETLSPSVSQSEQQALQDLVELAREGMSSSQWPCSGGPASSGRATGEHWEPDCLPLTGFVLPSKEQHPGQDDGAASLRQASLDRLLADFRAMVNNPHLSDVQFQLDSGDLLYAHQFVLYARCPLLMQFVNSEGFLAMEDGNLRVQRVLLSDTSTEAARVFLHYLYVSDTSLVPELTTDLSSLAHRFGVPELVHLCQQALAVAGAKSGQQEEQEGNVGPAESFQELLRSVWKGEAEETEETAEKEACEEDGEKVNDADMDEIYEFVATQRKMLRDEAGVETEEREPIGEENLGQVLLPEPSAGPLGVESPETAGREAPKEEAGPCSPSSPVGGCRAMGEEQPFPSPRDPGVPKTWSEQKVERSKARNSPRQKTPAAYPCLLPSQSPPHTHRGDLSTPVPLSQEDASLVPTQNLPSWQERHRGVSTQPKEPVREKGRHRSYSWECMNKGAPISPEPSPSIDLTQSKPSPGGSRPEMAPSGGSGSDEVILLLDSDEEWELEQNQHKAEGRSVLEDSPKSCELFPIIDVDSDPEDLQSPATGEADGASPPLFQDPDEADITESSWMVPATPLASGSQDCTLQTRASGQTVGESDRPQATKLSPARPGPVTPGSSNSRGRRRRTFDHPLPRSHQHGSPMAPSPDSGGLPSLSPHFQSPIRSAPGVATASEVVEVEDSEDEQEMASRQAHSSPLADGDSPIPSDCCWHVEPLSPIPIDHLNLECSGPLSTSSPGGRVREAMSSGAEHSPAPLSTTPIRGSCPGPRGSWERHARPGSPGSSRPSFLNSSLWDSWDGEEQRFAELPVLARTPTRTSGRSETPKGANQKLPPKVPITPMPRYSIMETPALKKELDRFGVRPLPKRQMVLKLKEIFQYTHQTLESDSDDSCQALCGQACATKTSEASRAAGCAQPDATTGLVPQTSKGPAKTKGPQSLKQQRREDFAAEGIPGGPDGDTQLSGSQESTAASVASSDTSFSSHSSSGEFGTAFESVEEDKEGVSASQVAMQTTAMEEAVSRFICSQPALYRKVLQYQPLELAVLQAELKQQGIQVATGRLMDFLDAHCITFTTAAARKEKARQKGQQPGVKKKGRKPGRPRAPSSPVASSSQRPMLPVGSQHHA